jgi:hypothetical protein
MKGTAAMNQIFIVTQGHKIFLVVANTAEDAYNYLWRKTGTKPDNNVKVLSSDTPMFIEIPGNIYIKAN